MPKALFWNHRFWKLASAEEWDAPARWTASALRKLGWEILKHPDVLVGFHAKNTEDITQADLVIYSHSHVGEVRGFDGPQWFFKSTFPTKLHSTLDPMGFGPYSSITYEKPPYESIPMAEVEAFDQEQGCRWRAGSDCKWGKGVLGSTTVREDDYILVLGQTFKDDTVDAMWFGDYWKALRSVVHALAQMTDRPVVVKLHPWVDGYVGFNAGVPIPSGKTEVSTAVKQELQGYGPNVRVYRGMGSVHSFLPKARAVVLCNSGAGLEALLHRKPVIAWGYPEYHWVCYDLRHLCDLPRALKTEDWFDADMTARFIYWYTERYAISSPESAVDRISRLL